MVAPVPKSPAAKAGIQSGDVLLEIDEESMSNASLDAVGEKLQGEAGTEVSVAMRKKNGKVETIHLIR